jgi:large subunit ribosomal protein L30e
MASKKAESVSKDVIEIRKLSEGGKLAIGTQTVIKKLKTGKVSRVFVTSNCPAEVKADVERYAALSKAEVVHLGIPNEELGVVCKKPFSISIAGLVKE